MQAQPSHTIPTQILDRFCVAGINYHKADTNTRGMFAVNKEIFTEIAKQAKDQGIRSVFVLSTCNRTEIYGFAEHILLLANLLTSATHGDNETFLRYAYLKNGETALDHLFKVASGLDSQIVGDYEILGQLKQSVVLATELDVAGPIMNRTINYAFQASKKIKTETALSSGTVSVSYAAIELLKALPSISEKRVLVVGAGKFGGNVCKNLQQYLPGTSISVVNRTDETARDLAGKIGVDHIPYSNLAKGVQQSDIVVVCTNAQEPTILPHFFNDDVKLVLDLSVPVNVHPDVKQLDNVRVIDVDEISISILDKTFAKRKSEIPKAEQIISSYKAEYLNWLGEYRYSLHIKTWKDKLQELSEWHPQQACEMSDPEPPTDRDKVAQKAVTRLAVNLRTNNEKGCQFINAINDYLQMS